MRVKTQYSANNDIIASIKACTVKYKTRQDMFHHLGSIVDPVLTRWRTWMSAAVWYSTHWLEIRRIRCDYRTLILTIEQKYWQKAEI